jgi:hypothetical protein
MKDESADAAAWLQKTWSHLTSSASMPAIKPPMCWAMLS